MARPKVLLLGEIKHAHDAWQAIGQLADVVVPRSLRRAAFLAECAAGGLDGCVAAYRTFDSTGITGRVDGELVAALPASLRAICHNGAGYDSIDVAACSARGIRVANTPDAVRDATADLALWLLLGALRNLAPGLANARAGRWRRDDSGRLPALGHDPRGKTLGILGMGGIGRTLARKAALAFGMRILYHNRHRLPPETERDVGVEVRYVDFDTLLRESDVLSLNLPLNPATRHTISGPQFDLMKPGVVLVNTARGAVMDESALVRALESGHVAAAGLDVYEHEPAVSEGLRAHPRVLLVPHMGTWTVETEKKMEETTIANVRGVLDGTGLQSGVPEQRDLVF